MEDKLTVSNFICSEHGAVAPTPVCSKCIDAKPSEWEGKTLNEVAKIATARENERCMGILERVFAELGEQGVTLDQLQRAVTIAQLPDAMTTEELIPQIIATSKQEDAVNAARESGRREGADGYKDYVLRTIDLYSQHPSKGLEWLKGFLTRKTDGMMGVASQE